MIKPEELPHSEFRLSGNNVWLAFRPNTSDMAVLVEVIEKREYRLSRLGFDVQEGETWLDLGANIGAFAAYCQLLGAEAECWEPDPDNFAILLHNHSAPERCHRYAISSEHSQDLFFRVSRTQGCHSRATAFAPGHSTLPEHSSGKLPNKHASVFAGRKFDGVKMDIEGAEFGLIDNLLLPAADKLCLEYHTSRDANRDNLRRRLEVLRDLYSEVWYPKEIDRFLAGQKPKPYYDRVFFCKGLK